MTRHEVIAKLHDALAGKVNWDDFDDWLLGRSWNMHLDSDADVQQLVRDIRGALSVYTDNRLNEAQFREELLGYMAPQEGPGQ